MDVLPTSLVSAILALAVDKYEVVFIPRAEPLPLSRLKDLATVSRAWAAHMEAIVSAFNTARLELCFESGSVEEFAANTEKLAKKQSTLLSLKLIVGSEMQRRDQDNTDLAFQRLEVNWNALFASCNPRLQRLDLSGLPLLSNHLMDVLDAAAVYCKNLQALVLPPKLEDYGVDSTVDPVFETLYNALRSWYESSDGRGLRQLMVPHRNAEHVADYSSEYLLEVARNCPAIEYLDGYEQTLYENEFVDCDELFYVTKDAWRSFCEVCTSLKHVHWVTLPFDDDFFRIFGDYVKPKLTSLSITQSYSWDDALYTELTRDEYVEVESSQALCHAVKACPNLQFLDIVVHETTEFDQNVFDDQFLITVAQSCPHLRELHILEESSDEELPVESITGVGVAVLGQLRSLSRLSLKNTSCTGAGIYSLLANALSHPNRAPIDDFRISVGGTESPDSQEHFYAVVEQFLMLVASTSIFQPGTNRFEVNILNPNHTWVDVELTATYRPRFHELKKWVEERNPGYRVTIMYFDHYVGQVCLYAKTTPALRDNN